MVTSTGFVRRASTNVQHMSNHYHRMNEIKIMVTSKHMRFRMKRVVYDFSCSHGSLLKFIFAITKPAVAAAEDKE